MNSELIRRYDRPVPRYTSYPTAPHFHPGVGADAYRRWLSRVAASATASLYFHVPFCARMCWYCGCHTKIVGRPEPVADYADTLAREIGLVAAALPARLRATHVHFGGGTPTMLAPDDLKRLMDTARAAFTFAPAAEIALEADPRTLTADTVQALAAAGVNRVSLGVQEFSSRVQHAINRIQPPETVRRAVGLLRDAGIERLNFDLMYGLPHQTADDIARTVDIAAMLGPDRIALFGYAHVPWMKTHQKMIDERALPDGPARWAQAETAARRLAEHGYRPIGLDHFVRPGDGLARALDQGRLRRNFQGYTDDAADVLLGFGASAIGALAQGYLQNAVPIGQYAEAIAAGRLAVARGIALNDDDRLRRAAIERLMCELAVDAGALARAHGLPEDTLDSDLAALAPLVADGLATIAGRTVRLTEAGRPFLRTVAAAFDRYLDSGKGRHSRAV